MKKHYDAIIIGKGPAGISASLYLVRAKKDVLVIGKDFGSLEKAHSIDNYYGLEKPLSGIELAKQGVEQAKKLGVTVLTAEVTATEMLYPPHPKTNANFTVKVAKRTSENEASTEEIEFTSSLILIATGKERTGLKIPGFEEYKGHGISFCATCDGFFYKGKTLAVIGNGAFAANELNYLYNLTKDITLYTNGKQLEEGVKEMLPPDVPVNTDNIHSINGTAPASEGGIVCSIATAPDAKNGVEFACRNRPVQGIFIALGTAGAASFAAHLGLQTGEGPNSSSLVVKHDFKTNIPGIYAAGDSTGGFLQVSKAVSDGAIAGSAMVRELNKIKAQKKN
ncbi:MAG: hypothetical protein BKP49_05565 [Treponema sp. CETP13]|nr:MAG: hypothetical protein BKP49_05565 [Treponema sp. CETP13]